MTLDQLVEGARALPLVPADAAALYAASSKTMADLVNADLLGRGTSPG